jgi:hypothetical protein
MHIGAGNMQAEPNYNRAGVQLIQQDVHASGKQQPRATQQSMQIKRRAFTQEERSKVRRIIVAPVAWIRWELFFFRPCPEN